MRNFLGTSLLVGTLLFGGASIARAQVSFGIRIGPPPHVRVERRAARPGRDYVWVPGYWYPDPDGDGHYTWHGGYWTRPPYEGAYWVAPRRDRGMFYEGYWSGPRGRVEHDHAWDRDNNRDYDHYRNEDNNRRNYDNNNRGSYNQNQGDHRDNDHHDNDDNH